MASHTKTKTAKAKKSQPGTDINLQLDTVEKLNASVQKLISSFGARLNVIRHLLSKI